MRKIKTEAEDLCRTHGSKRKLEGFQANLHLLLMMAHSVVAAEKRKCERVRSRTSSKNVFAWEVEVRRVSVAVEVLRASVAGDGGPRRASVAGEGVRQRASITGVEAWRARSVSATEVW